MRWSEVNGVHILIPEHKRCVTVTVDLFATAASKWLMGMWWLMLHAGGSRIERSFDTLPRMGMQLRSLWVVYVWDFPFNISRLWLELQKVKSQREILHSYDSGIPWCCEPWKQLASVGLKNGQERLYRGWRRSGCGAEEGSERGGNCRQMVIYELNERFGIFSFLSIPRWNYLVFNWAFQRNSTERILIYRKALAYKIWRLNPIIGHLQAGDPAWWVGNPSLGANGIYKF